MPYSHFIVRQNRDENIFTTKTLILQRGLLKLFLSNSFSGQI